MIIKNLTKNDFPILSEAFKKQGWNKPVEQYENYFREQEKQERMTLVAWMGKEIAGYVTIVWNSVYPSFAEKKIPEIMDLNVLEKFQGNGIASTLMDRAEDIVFENNAKVGICVGLTSNYGAAQRLYAKRGYIPDGKGISCNEHFVEYCSTVKADDDLVLGLIKEKCS